MKGDKIPDQNHIARYCRSKHTSDGQIQASAFMLRSGEESLSVNCLELLNCSSRENEVVQIRRIYEAKLSVGARAKIAILNVGEVRNHVLNESLDRRNLAVLHDPHPQDPSHSGVYNLREDDELIAELILETVRETYSARA
jgi:hypothetical protein